MSELFASVEEVTKLIHWMVNSGLDIAETFEVPKLINAGVFYVSRLISIYK